MCPSERRSRPSSARCPAAPTSGDRGPCARLGHAWSAAPRGAGRREAGPGGSQRRPAVPGCWDPCAPLATASSGCPVPLRTERPRDVRGAQGSSGFYLPPANPPTAPGQGCLGPGQGPARPGCAWPRQAAELLGPTDRGLAVERRAGRALLLRLRSAAPRVGSRSGAEQGRAGQGRRPRGHPHGGCCRRPRRPRPLGTACPRPRMRPE